MFRSIKFEKPTFSFRSPSRDNILFRQNIWRCGNENRSVETISATTATATRLREICSVAPASQLKQILCMERVCVVHVKCVICCYTSESLLIKICFRREKCELSGLGSQLLSETKSVSPPIRFHRNGTSRL